jgi:hypothetical protein
MKKARVTNYLNWTCPEISSVFLELLQETHSDALRKSGREGKVIAGDHIFGGFDLP